MAPFRRLGDGRGGRAEAAASFSASGLRLLRGLPCSGAGLCGGERSTDTPPATAVPDCNQRSRYNGNSGPASRCLNEAWSRRTAAKARFPSHTNGAEHEKRNSHKTVPAVRKAIVR